MVVGWKPVLILFSLESLVEGGTIANIKNVILATFITYVGLSNEQIIEQVVCWRVDGVSTFQGLKFEIIVLMKT